MFIKFMKFSSLHYHNILHIYYILHSIDRFRFNDFFSWFFSFQAIETLKQISDGSIDDVDFSLKQPDVSQCVNPATVDFEIKRELPENSEAFTNDYEKKNVIETTTEATDMVQHEIKEEVSNNFESENKDFSELLGRDSDNLAHHVMLDSIGKSIFQFKIPSLDNA